MGNQSLQTYYEGVPSEVMIGISLTLYCAALGVIVCFIIWLFSIRNFRKVPFIWKNISWGSPSTLFVIFLTASFFLRIIFFIFDYWINPVAGVVARGCVYITEFAAYTLLLFHWSDLFIQALKKKTPSIRHEPFFHSWSVRVVWFLVNLSMYLAQLALWIAIFATVDWDNATESTQDNTAYHIDIIFYTSLYLVIGFLFLLFGFFMLFLLFKRIGQKHAFIVITKKKRIRFAFLILGQTLFLLLSFLAKFAVLLYFPITGTYVNVILWDIVIYITEIPVALTLLFLQIRERRHKMIKAMQIQNHFTVEVDKHLQLHLMMHGHDNSENSLFTGTGTSSDDESGSAVEMMDTSNQRDADLILGLRPATVFQGNT